MIEQGKYCGDEKMEEYLREIGSPCSLHGVYGLFHGCLAAPGMVMPSTYMPLILGEEGATFETKEQAIELTNNLVNLWNRIARWDPEREPAKTPVVEHPCTPEGVMAHVEQCGSLVTYFIKGLELGGIEESNLPEEVLDVLESFSRIRDLLGNYSELYKKGYDHEEAALQSAHETLEKIEMAIGSGFARINLGLKTVRMHAVAEMGEFAFPERADRQARSSKVGRNEPCPCGIGRKYKKCCGLTH